MVNKTTSYYYVGRNNFVLVTIYRSLILPAFVNFSLRREKTRVLDVLREKKNYITLIQYIFINWYFGIILSRLYYNRIIVERHARRRNYEISGVTFLDAHYCKILYGENVGIGEKRFV